MPLLSNIRSTRNDDKDIVSKAKVKATSGTRVLSGGDIVSRLHQIIALVEEKLGHHKDEYILIRTMDDLLSYLDNMEKVGIAALDTETTGLDPLKDKLVGVCLYTEGLKPAYVPINHISASTNLRVVNQLTEEDVRVAFENRNIKWIFHNADFDIRILRHTCKLYLKAYWDTQIAANFIDENESHQLKDLHLKYCPEENETESLTFSTLFDKINFALVPTTTAYLYAAGDAIKTFRLYKFQKAIMETLTGPYYVFRNIEMPLVDIVADMEDDGVAIDYEVSDRLSEKYHKMSEEIHAKVDVVIAKYQSKIEDYILSHPKTKIKYPVNIGSSQQLSALFYDVLGAPAVNKKSPRSTDEDTLTELAKNEKYKELCDIILDYRGNEKLLSTYIDKIPSIAREYDDRVHCQYKQYGAKTGRFSSKDPNLQNIPSHNKEIRTMFKATPGYTLISGDYSKQEPLLTAQASNDAQMKLAFKEGKDIYSAIASLAYAVPYEECLEFRPDGSTNEEGANRRSAAKSIVLGICYGKGIPAIAEDLNVTVQRAQEIYDKVMTSFENLKTFMDETQQKARTLGYVETIWGRRRHLPDMQLPPYEFKYVNGVSADFDPLDFSDAETDYSVPIDAVQKYTKQMQNMKFKDRERFKEKLRAENNIEVKDNNYFIAQAERQCVNSVIQGSAADMSKLAMIHIAHDKRLKELDYHMLIPIHDEIVGECPIENAKEASERVAYLMIHAGDGTVDLPLKVDIACFENWYGEKLKIA